RGGVGLKGRVATTQFCGRRNGFFRRRDCGPKWAVCPAGEREPQRTNWKAPPLVGIFGASPDVGRKRECVVVDATPSNRSHLGKFPDTRENTGNFARFGPVF